MKVLERVEISSLSFLSWALSASGEVRSRVDELVVGYFDETEGFRVEAEGGALLVDGGYALEEFDVEIDGVLMGGELGSFDTLDLLEGGVGVGSGDAIEDLP